MTVPQVVTVRKGKFRPHFDEAVKPDPATVELLRGLLKWTHARGLRAEAPRAVADGAGGAAEEELATDQHRKTQIRQNTAFKTKTLTSKLCWLSD